MNTQYIIRLAGPLYDRVKADLARPHPFAAERVGFLFMRIGTGPQGTILLFPVGYMSLQDDQYVDENDPLIGAAINGDAIRSAMQHVLNTEMGALYVHMHTHHWGQPYFSSIDWRDLPGIVQSLQNANSQLIHGALLFSQDTATGALWPPEQGVCKPVIPRVSIVGYPLKICTGGAS